MVRLGKLVEIGKDRRSGGLVVGQKSRLGGQEIAARGAFGAADFQQQALSLVFDLDGVHHPAAVLARLVDQDDRGRADRDQHQKSRRKQQDLADRAPARGVRRHNNLAS